MSLTKSTKPAKSRAEKFLKSPFQTPRARREEFFSRLGGILLRGTEISSLLRRVAVLLAEQFSASQVEIVVKSGDDMRTVATSNAKKLPKADIRLIAAELCPKKLGNRVFDTFLLTNEKTRTSLELHGVVAILNLSLNGKCVGYVLMGKPLSSGRKSGYSTADKRLLEAASGELVIAIKNAQALEEVQMLNETLQQRIDDATRELRISNKQLQRLDEAKNEFISMASHQLRTPLTSIKGYLDMVLAGDLGQINATQRAVLGEAFSSSERMVQLISDFLNISRLQTGKFLIDKRDTDMAQLVKDTAKLLKVVAQQRDLKLVLEIDKKLPMLSLDTEKFRQVVLNMIDNAIYYSPPNSQIKITLKQGDGSLIFTVKDSGIGVPESEKSRLFGKFFRGSNARKKRPDGTGVGLFLARKVVLAHGGEIIFESVEGQGSTFGFSLPALR